MRSRNKKNTKFIWTKEFIILLVFLLVFIGAAIALNLPTSKERRVNRLNDAISTYNTANSTSYSTLTEENVYKEISHDDLAVKKNQDAYTYVLYGSLSDGTFLDELAKINTAAKNYDIDLVYICDSSWYTDQEDKDTVEFRTLVDQKQDALNKKVDDDQKDFDVSLGTTLLVFKSDVLIFNSQTYSSSDSASEYDWSKYVNKALTLNKNEN